MKSISFCTTCKGRLWQLQQTLPTNVSRLEEGCDIIILDYQSPDGLKEWLFENFDTEIQNGKIKYFSLNENYNYSSSYAKNLAHKLATGDILFNLDGDNYITGGLIQELRTIKDSEIFLPRYHGNDEGSFGRLAYTKKTFYKLNGYNENIVGMKGDDGDLRARCIPLQLVPRHSKYKHVAIQNTQEQKDLYTDVEGLVNPPLNYPAQWGKATITDKDGQIINL